MELLNEIWQHINPLIDWMVFALVIALGYLVKVANLLTGILPEYSNTLKILLFSLIVTVLYSYFQGISGGKFIASYFLAFGFHSAILKLIERKLFPSAAHKEAKLSNIVGPRPGDRG